MSKANGGRPTAKRTDVGYGRPPIEHQFKAGQKPPPRKKCARKPPSVRQSLTRILGEERRLMIGKKAGWYTNAFLLIEVAFQLAEKGNSTVSRALADYLMACDAPEAFSDEPKIEYDRDGPGGVFNYTRRVRI